MIVRYYQVLESVGTAEPALGTYLLGFHFTLHTTGSTFFIAFFLQPRGGDVIRHET
jgi:hypothetical protein